MITRFHTVYDANGNPINTESDSYQLSIPIIPKVAKFLAGVINSACDAFFNDDYDEDEEDL